MVIWGVDSKPEGNIPHQISFCYVLTGKRRIEGKSPTEGKTGILEIPRLREITDGKMHFEIDDIIYWLLGTKYYSEYDYSKALEYFKKISNKYHNDDLLSYKAFCYSPQCLCIWQSWSCL